MKNLRKLYILLVLCLSISFLASCSLLNSDDSTIDTNEETNFEEKFASLYPKILLTFDEDYVPNMAESDFEDPSEYEDYLNYCKISAAYSKSLINNDIYEDHAVNILKNFINLTESDDLDLNSFKLYINNFEDYGLTSNILANLMVDLSEAVIDIYATNDNTELINNLKTLIEDERDDLVTSLETVFSYLDEMYYEFFISTTRYLEILEKESITLEELFVLKNGIVHVLQYTLPEISDFENMLLIEKILYNFFIGEKENITIDEDYLNKLSTIYHHSFRLFIKFIDAIDEEFLEMYNTYLQPAITKHCYYDEDLYEEVCEIVDFDLDSIRSFIFYMNNKVKSFIEYNEESIDALNTILENEQYTQLSINIYKSLIHYVLENNYLMFDSIDNSRLQELIDDALDNIPLMKQARKIMIDLGIDVFDEFMLDQAQILLFIDQLMERISKDDVSDINEHVYNISVDLGIILNDFNKYVNVSLNKLTQDDILILTKAFLHQEKYNMITDDLSLNDVNNFIDDIAQELSPLIYKIIQVKVSVISKLSDEFSDIDFTLESFENIDELSYYDSLIQHIIIALNENLDETTKNEIITNIEDIFDVLNEYSVSLNLNTTEINEIETDILNYVEDILNNISTIATYDFNNLTTEQLETYQEFLELFTNNDEVFA